MKTNRGSRAAYAVGSALMALLAACEAGDRNVARDQSAAASAETTPDTGAPGGAPTTTPKAGLTDANIVAILDAANKADSAGGAVAAKKGTRADVKAFGKLMMGEHHALRVQGQQLANQLGVEPKPPERDPLAPYVAGATKALQTPKGSQFDQAYIDNEVSIHSAVLDFANQARVTTQTPQLRDLIEKAIPIIQKHLEQAQAIQKELTPAA